MIKSSVVLLILLLASTSLAEDRATKYSPGFVKGIMKSPGQASSGSEQFGEGMQGTDLREGILSQPVVDQPFEDPGSEAPTKINRSSEDKPGVKVSAIGAILTLSHGDKLEGILKVLHQSVDQFNFRIGHVYFLMSGPNFATLNPELLRALGKRGGDPHVKLWLPKEYNTVKKSPSWIISTSKGDVLLEGASNPLDYFNSRGEFVEPTVGEAPVGKAKEAEL